MEATITPIMEPISVPGRISGHEVIADLLDRVAERLSTSCDLRQSDSYAAYSAKVSVELQLRDVDTVSASQQITVGTLDAEQLSQRITVTVPPVSPEEVAERLGLPQTESLERSVDGSMPEPAAAAASKRHYTPRGAVPLGSRGYK
jgi:hypothetical protein